MIAYLVVQNKMEVCLVPYSVLYSVVYVHAFVYLPAYGMADLLMMMKAAIYIESFSRAFDDHSNLQYHIILCTSVMTLKILSVNTYIAILNKLCMYVANSSYIHAYIQVNMYTLLIYKGISKF